jgi:hypothetical protein
MDANTKWSFQAISGRGLRVLGASKLSRIANPSIKRTRPAEIV